MSLLRTRHSHHAKHRLLASACLLPDSHCRGCRYPALKSSVKEQAATEDQTYLSECLVSLGVRPERASQLAAANEDDFSSLPSERVAERLSLLKAMQLQPDVILRSPSGAQKEPNLFWPLLDTQNSDLDSLCDFLTDIGAEARDISTMLYKCPQAARLSVMHVSEHILHLRALGMPMDDIIYTLSQAPLLFAWDPEYFRRAAHIFIPNQAHPKSAHHLSLAFGVSLQGSWLPARRTQYSLPVVEELCTAVCPGSPDVWKRAWVFRSWLGDFSGENLHESFRPLEAPLMSAAGVCSARDAERMIEVLCTHMEHLEREEEQGREFVSAVVQGMPQLLLHRPATVSSVVRHMRDSGIKFLGPYALTRLLGPAEHTA